MMSVSDFPSPVAHKSKILRFLLVPGSHKATISSTYYISLPQPKPIHPLYKFKSLRMI